MNILRPSNAYGEGQQVWRVLPRAVLCGITGQKLPLEGGGLVKKSYLHARDLANAIHLVTHKGHPGEIYNVGPDNPSTIVSLIQIIADQLEIELNQLCEITPGRVGEDNQYWLNSDKIKADVGWVKEVTLEKGIEALISWGNQYKEILLQQETFFQLRA